MSSSDSSSTTPEFDVLIKGGTVIDGTRAPRVTADVGIKGDQIVALGDLSSAKGAFEIDATGKIVAPGFVDVHNHSDSWLLNTPNFLSKTSQGFTTEVIMADGISYAPVDRCTAADWIYYLQSLDGLYPEEYTGWESLEDYMNLLDGRNVQNVMTHIPYANLRSMHCGFGRQRVDDFQMKLICSEVRKGMEAGAVGISTGLDYVAQCFSPTDELVEACQAMAEYDGLYVSHIRYKKTLMPAIEELVEIGKRAGVKVHISHMKGQHPGQAEEALEYIDKVARHEVDISFDVYPYQPGSTMLHFLLPYEVFEEGPRKAVEKLKQPEMQQRFKYGLENYLLDISAIQIAWVLTEKNKQHQGKMLSQYVEETGLPKEEALIKLLIEEEMAVLLVFNMGDDRLVDPVLQHDLYMMGTDGIYMDGGVIHPRQFGSAARILGPCVRDHKLFSLEDAVYKLSGCAAQRFGMEKRSILKQGNYADIVVFDPETIQDNATYSDPQQYSTGIEYVLTNGVPIVHNNQPLDIKSETLPGRYVRYQPR
ncbi:D-aminoacylase [Gimesia chilikensis]|uniref:D-aminoacylase n=1 Tax=Gimesia chilikensis TaxID=2605989 RepID=A0A517WCG0_9PLAN|nr:D-aminoacylase [Gimesia chilikensis]QDU02932.1 D-aminoacylase [Gimesia chilikensis]